MKQFLLRRLDKIESIIDKVESNWMLYGCPGSIERVIQKIIDYSVDAIIPELRKTNLNDLSLLRTLVTQFISRYYVEGIEAFHTKYCKRKPK